MNKNEILEFIEEMQNIGDNWEEADVERVYGDTSLEEALTDRKASIGMFADIIENVINR